MRNWNKWVVLVLGCGLVVALIFAGRASLSQPLPLRQQEAAASTSGRSDVLFRAALPFLQPALSSQLDFRPEFREVESGKLSLMQDEVFSSYVRWHFPGLEGIQAKGAGNSATNRSYSIARQIYASAFVARYDESEHVFCVAPENLQKIAAWDKELAPAHSDQFLQLALVHEVARVHLERCFHLPALRGRCRDAEEFDALQTLIEGRAQAVTREVAVKLGSQAVFPLLAKCCLRVPDNAPDASIRAVSQTALQTRYRACVQGMAFFDGLTAAGVRDPEALVFARPPRQLSVIAQPHRWVEDLNKKQSDLTTVLKPLETILSGDWQQQQQCWTPAMLSQVASMLGANPERTEKIGSTWYEGRSLIWTQRRNPAKQIALSVVRHVDEAGARAHFGFAVELQRKQDVQPNASCGGAPRIIDAKSTTLHLAGFEEAIQTEKKIAFGESDTITVTELLARSGSMMIECSWRGLPCDPVLAERMLQRVRNASD